MTLRILTAILTVSVGLSAAQMVKFKGRQVTVTEAELDDDGVPRAPVSVCIEGPPMRQCYTAPKSFGSNPSVEVIQINKTRSALFFSADSDGGSGYMIHFAVLQPSEDGGSLEDLLGCNVTNQSEYTFFRDPTISAALIFVTADYIWARDEGHYGAHRYIVSAFTLRPSTMLDEAVYDLQDRYMTARYYDREQDKVSILKSEKQEIIARLRRLKTRSPARKAH